jgi:UDP-galactopyranose mutase
MTQTIAIAGAGLSGAVLARELAERDRRVVVFEAQSHVGGHCHTERDPSTGVLLHCYGGHVFHTDREDVWRFVNRFAEFMPYTVRVRAVTSRGVFSLPLNLLTLNQFFKRTMSPSEARELVDTLGDRDIEDPKNFEEQALRSAGRELYETFFRGYTRKQWGVHPQQLPASIFRRLPIRFSYDDAYFDNRWQGIPREGYTPMIERMLDHPGVALHLEESFDPGTADNFDHVFFTGPLDAWFRFQLGRLGYRSLRFERIEAEGDYQGAPLLTYCEESVPWTRVLEHKHLAPWETHERTVAFREHSHATGPLDTPFYPLRLADDEQLLRQYVELAGEQKGVTFLGRLGTYRYLDMEVVVGEALDLARRWTTRSPGASFPTFSHPPL